MDTKNGNPPQKTQSLKYTGQFIVAGFLLLLCGIHPAHAANCAPVPNTFVNGQNADANQVNANFGAIITCTNSNLLGAANNLSDLGSASAARTNLGLGTSAVENLGSNVGDDGSGNLLSKSTLHVALQGTGNFTIPAGITTATQFKITVVGGGGAGGAASGGTVVGGGGGSGGYTVGWFSGFTAGQTVAVTLGAGGSSSGANGAATTVLAPNSTQIMQCSGGAGGSSQPGSGSSFGGGSGTCVVTASGSGLTLVGQIRSGAQGGGFGANPYFSGFGGGNPIGGGGLAVGSGTTGAGGNGQLYGAGGGGAATTGSSIAGGTGAQGVTFFEWVQ